jgi:hypothetical protein
MFRYCKSKEKILGLSSSWRTFRDDSRSPTQNTTIVRLDHKSASNRAKVDPFYIQGWKKGKFYPDFVAVTKKGNIVALEWKGEDRLDNPDTLYKTEIAKEWAKLGKGNLHFYLVHNGNVDEVLSELKNL